MTTAITSEVYNKIDNRLYNKPGDIWWDENTVLYLLKTSVNPCRFPYYLNTYTKTLRRDAKNKTALDIGCGGGILAEEFAAAGFKNNFASISRSPDQIQLIANGQVDSRTLN